MPDSCCARQFEVAHGLAVVVGIVGVEQGAGKVDLDDRRARQKLDGAAVGEHGFGGAAVFVQHLAAHLVEVGIVRIFLEQAVDAEQRRAQRALAIPGDGARVARLHRAVGFGEALQGDVGGDEAHQLGDHAMVHRRGFAAVSGVLA